MTATPAVGRGVVELHPCLCFIAPYFFCGGSRIANEKKVCSAAVKQSLSEDCIVFSVKKRFLVNERELHCFLPWERDKDLLQTIVADDK